MSFSEDILYNLSDIRKTYKTSEEGQPALDIDKLDIPKNKVVVILGESGSGKTTLLNLLGMLDIPDSKNNKKSLILFNNLNKSFDLVKDKSKFNKLRKETFGFIFQEGYLLKNLSSKLNIKIPLFINRLDTSKTPIDDFLKNVALDPVKFSNRLPGELSGGQAQRMAIIRSIIYNPRVILADEPSSRLDRDNGLQVMKLLVDWCHSGDNRTLIWVTHNLEQAAKFGDHIIILQDGKVLKSQKNWHHDEQTLLQLSRGEDIQVPQDIVSTDSNHEQSSFWKNIPFLDAASPLLNLFKFIFLFALSDIFPQVHKKVIKGLLSKSLNYVIWGIKSFLGVYKTQGLNILSLFMILLLALFFSNVSFWLKNYFVYSSSDPRINNITVKGKKRGDAVLSQKDMEKLSTLTWVSASDSDKKIISWSEEIKNKGLKPGQKAIIGAFGSRDRPMDFSFNKESNEGGWDNLVTLSLVATNAKDPILKQIDLWTGETLKELKPSTKKLNSLFLNENGEIDFYKPGVIITRDSLEKDLGYIGKIPKTIEINLNSKKREFTFLGVSDWLPFGADALVSEGWYEKNFLSSGPGDPVPGYDRITIYIRDMLEDGLPLAETLIKMGYQTVDDVKSRLSWIKNLTDFIFWSAFFALIGIAFLVAGTLMVSYTQAIRKKQHEIGVLLAHGIPKKLLYLIFIVEILIVWIIAVMFALPVHIFSSDFFKQIMIEKFDLHMTVDKIFFIPDFVQLLIFGVSLFLAVVSVLWAVNRIIRGQIADIMKTAE
ncbi:putative ABC transport system permease protein [Candidatus Magnetomoraceae bacterium gMMP-15]